MINSNSKAVEYIDAAILKPNQKNARSHSRQQVLQVARSIRAFGFNNPILIDKDNVVIAGHCRLEAALEVGLAKVPCIRLPDLSPSDLRAYMIADNQLALKAGWDIEILASEMTDLMTDGIDLTVVGFEPHEVDKILADQDEASTKPTESEDACPARPEGSNIVSRHGDHFVLGRHALVCGDAKDPATIELVMGKAKADMIFTDCPYNLPIPGMVSGLGKKCHPNFAEASGELSLTGFTEFLERSFEAMEPACRNGAIVFTCMDWRHLREILQAGHSVFSELKNICIWNKTNAGMGTFYRSQYEMVLVWKIGDTPHTNNFGLGDKGRHRTNIWIYPGVNSFKSDRLEELASHPTVKPVNLVADAIRDVSNRGDIVLDPFGGSGTTLIAAEKTGRLARLVEIDPGYCDVIIARWERLTGKKAVHLATGQTFDFLREERCEHGWLVMEDVK